MYRLSIEAIQVVDAIARTGSFTAAAEVLHKVPSTISYTVSKLENQLGMAIFDRNGSRVQLTPAGKTLIEEGRWLLRAVGDLECRLRRVSSGYETELRIAVDSLIPLDTLSENLRAFQELACGTQLRIQTEVMTGTWEALREGRADLVVAAGEGPAGGGYETYPVGSIPFVFCTAPNHPLAQLNRPLLREDLIAHTVIVVADSARSLPPRTVGFAELGQNRITVSDLTAKRNLQIAGLGYGFLPEPWVRHALRLKKLVVLKPPEQKMDENLWLAWRPENGGMAFKWWKKQLSRILVPDAISRVL